MPDRPNDSLDIPLGAEQSPPERDRPTAVRGQAETASLAMTEIRVSASSGSLWEAPAQDVQIPGYALEAQIGAGGMGLVYRARQLNTGGRVVALKVIRPRMLEGDADNVAAVHSRFRREIEATARLEHENIVPIYEAGESHGCCYYAMQFISGGSLADWIKRRALTPQQAARFIEQAARGLAHAHAQQIIHRDISPHNLLIDEPNQRALVVDFGLAKIQEASNETRTAAVLGKFAYMPPEQFLGTAHVDERADIYSLGATLYEALTNTLPHGAGSFEQLLVPVRDVEPAPPRTLNPEVPIDLETICLKCLRKDPEDRYPSAAALADDLARFARGEPIQARRVSLLEKARSWVRRNRRLAAAVAVSLVLTLLLIAGGLVANSQRRNLSARNERSAFATALADARRLGSSGRWKEAQQVLDSAQPYDAESRVRRQLERARAHQALDELGQYCETIVQLTATPDADARQAEVKLHRSQVARLLGNRDEAEQLARAALQAGLDPAQAAYARSLLAESTPEARAQLEAALQLDPVYQEALYDLIGLQLISGEFTSATARLEAAQALFPQDSRPPLFAALGGALRGDEETLRDELAGLESTLGAERVETVRNTLTRLANCARLWNRRWLGSANDAGVAEWLDLVKLLGEIATAKTKVQSPSGASGGAATPEGLTFPPVAYKILLPFQSYALRQLNPLEKVLNGDKLVLQDLEKCTQVHPDAVFYLMQATIYTNTNRSELAIERAQAGSQTFSLFAGTQARCRMLVALALVRSDRSQAAAVKASAEIRAALAAGPLQPEEWHFAAQAAIQAQDEALQREVISRWRVAQPESTLILNVEFETALKSGRFGAAEDHLRELEKRSASPADIEKLKARLEKARAASEQSPPMETR